MCERRRVFMCDIGLVSMSKHIFLQLCHGEFGEISFLFSRVKCYFSLKH